MNNELAQVLGDWKYLRKNTVAFISTLSQEELIKKLPRPGIDTFMKHFQEMCDVEEAYLNACVSGTMEFDCVKENDEYEGNCTKEEILDRMQQQDDRIQQIISECEDNTIEWDEDDIKTLNSQLRNLCIHETLHLGQLIAFSYVMGFKLPEYVVEGWALS